MPSKKKRRAGRPPKISKETLKTLLALMSERPNASMSEYSDLLEERTGVRVVRETLYKTLSRQGYRRVRPPRAPSAPASSLPAAAQGAASKRYGYTAMHRGGVETLEYPSSLTDAEWEVLAPLFERTGPGRPEQHSRRTMLDAMCYAVRSGCSWRMLPKQFPPWQAVYAMFRRWARAGLFEGMHDRLRAMWREREGRRPEPTAAIVDSQSVRTSEQGGPHGFDAGKKINGRKRHLVTDTLGLLLAVFVHTADIQDRAAAEQVVERAKQKHPTVTKMWVDGGYAGKCADALRVRFGLDVEVTRRPNGMTSGRWTRGQLSLPAIPSGFILLPRRWVIERTNAWSARPRRMSKDFDRRLDVAEAWVWFTHGRLLVRRLAHADPSPARA